MLIVQKFGGTSVGDIERIRKVAKKVVEIKRAGNDVVVVVSAMAGETDRLINLAYKLTDNPDMRELDV
jgi:aspartate kinase